MFNSIRSWLNRTDTLAADAHALEAEAKQFRLPSETLPQIFKVAFFIGLGCLNYRLFSRAVPGVWGQATGIVACMAEGIALYCSHNLSRSSGLFRVALGMSGACLMTFSLIHGTFSILDLIGVGEVSGTVEFYSRVIAFPLLSGLVGLSVIAITMTHPQNIIRLKHALAHTRIVTGRAEAASQLQLMRAEAVLEQAKLDQFRERSRRESEYLTEVAKLVHVEERKRSLVSAITDPELRASLARELGIGETTNLPTRRPGFVAAEDKGKGGVLD